MCSIKFIDLMLVSAFLIFMLTQEIPCSNVRQVISHK